MNKLEKLKAEVITILSNGKGSHDWEHTERVCNMSNHLAKAEKADIHIVEAAALLHDIGRHEQDKSKGKLSHSIISSKMARPILMNLGYGENDIQSILHCIESHSYRKGTVPESIEAKVLFDADKLDAIGAIGIGRAFVFAGEVGAAVHIRNLDIPNTSSYSREDTAYREFKVKLEKIKDRMYTDEGKRLARERHEFMTAFFTRLDKETTDEI